jgi:hypothetical protein
MDSRMADAIKVGLICGIILVLFTVLAIGITNTVYADMIRQPVPPAGSPTPTPTGNLSDGIMALLIEVALVTAGWMLILASGGALYTQMARSSLKSIRETITWSSIAGVLSVVAMVIIAIACMIATTAISLIIDNDLLRSISSTTTGFSVFLVVLSPIWVIAVVPGIMSAAIGGFACRAYILKQADSGEPNGR